MPNQEDWTLGEVVRAIQKLDATTERIEARLEDMRWRPVRALQALATGVISPLLVTGLAIILFGKGIL